MSGDYSKASFKPSQNYSGVYMQQGRVHLDRDWNEQQAIQDRRLRAETIDILGRAIVPKETQDGFRIELVNGEMLIHPGRMYVDGLLAENHGNETDRFNPVLQEEVGSVPVNYTAQAYLPDAPALPADGPHIVYLDVWQRELTHVNRPDLVEAAVGVDTTTRSQTVWQVKVLPLEVEQLNCTDEVEAWDDLIVPSAGRLSTASIEVVEADDPCLLPASGGYRGLENRLYRVEIHDEGDLNSATFKWARHNASVETAITVIDGTQLTVVQSQWDAVRRFDINDWVEITDDGRELAGQPGEMRRIDDINYATNTITLDSALSADLAVNQVDAALRHSRIKRWDQLQQVDVNRGVIPVANGPAFHLEDGIQISFDLDTNFIGGEFNSGDYWLFAVRSADASVEALNHAPPRGIHHHYARLAVVTFPSNVIDCRGLWPPAMGQSGCCTVTVGDGLNSHGDYESIQAAIDSLPANGGRVCVLAGEFQENILISGRDNVSLSGCGTRTRIVSTPPDTEFGDADPVILIKNSSRVLIDAIEVVAHTSGIGVLVEETPAQADDRTPLPLQDIELAALHVYAAFGSGIECRAGERIAIHDCDVRMRDVPTGVPGIFVIGEDIAIQHNRIRVEAQPNTTTNTVVINAGRGGIQIGGTAEQVRVIDNLIQFGLGDGISLGSLVSVNPQGNPLDDIVAWPQPPEDPCDPCSPPSPKVPTNPVEGETAEVYRSAGGLYDITIANNRIYDMGRNGIGVAAFFNLEELDEFISVEGLTIRANEIRGCLNKPLAEIDEVMLDTMGYGGIALGDVTNLVIQQNIIEDNGPDHLEPICGVFVLHASGVELSDNRIVNNGAKTDQSAEQAKRGLRGGIYLGYAVTPTIDVDLGTGIKYPRQNGVPAVKIHGNTVSQPLGRALSIRALGPVVVSNNEFTTRGVLPYALPWPESVVAACVYIINLGLSNEFYFQLLGFASLTAATSLPSNPALVDVGSDSFTFIQPGEDDFRIGRYLANGNVMFSNNQCVLDLLEVGVGLVLTSVMIASLDDVAFQDNQCDCSLLTDFVFFHVFLLAPSLRCSDNRLKEGAFNAILSAVTYAWMNATSGNQTTRCLWILSLPELKVEGGNRSLIEYYFPLACESFNGNEEN